MWSNSTGNATYLKFNPFFIYFNGEKQTVLRENGGFYVFDKNSRETYVYFKTKGGVCAI